MKKSLFGMILLYATVTQAQDRLFTYTYQSLVLSKGQREIEVWTTFRNGRNEFFRGMDHRIEFEIGLGSNIQTAFYLNYGYATAVVNENNIESVNSTTSYSFSNEWKIKLSDPVANALGSGLYFEYGISPGEIELEGKLILDKQIGRSLHVFNLVGEYEFEKEFEEEGNVIDDETEREPYLELNYAWSYKLGNHASIGLEARDQNQFSSSGEWENAVFSMGPCFSYYSNSFWANLTLMPQVTDFKTGSQELNYHEKFQARLLFSFAL